MPRVARCALFLALLSCAIPAVALASAPVIPIFQLKWGIYGSTPSQFNVPWGIATDALGDVFVADWQNHRIEKFDHLGNLITTWGSLGTGASQFQFPGGVAADASGNVYATDMNNHRVQKFTSAGVWLATWGSAGSGDGQFSAPIGITTDAAGNVYVADRLNQRIQKFTSGGAFLTKWGSGGSGDGQFADPTGMATDAAGNVYVVDYNNGRIQKFSSTGAFITKWGTSGSGNGQFISPYDVAVDAVGNVYVADGTNNRIQKFTSTGTYLGQWGTPGSGDGQFVAPRGVEVDAAGNVYVADGNNRIQKFSGAGLPLADGGLKLLFTQGTLGSGDGQFSNNPFGVTTDPAGNYYIADGNNNRIQKFSSAGAFILKFGTLGSAPGQLYDPTAVAMLGSGTELVVADEGNQRLQVFSQFGAPISQVGGPGSGPGQFNFPHALAVGPGNLVYVADEANNRIQVFTWSYPILSYSSQWGSPGTGPGQFQLPNAVAVDKSGYVYVSDYSNNRVQKFTAGGIYVTEWGSFGTGHGQFYNPGGVGVDGQKNVYVADPQNGRVQKFTSNGTYLSEVAGIGYPRDLGTDAAGNLYVVDGNSRVLKFAVPPAVAFVSDIRNDQGREIRVRVLRSSTDASIATSQTTLYDVFRRIDPLPGATAVRSADGAAPANAQLAGWEQVGTFSAYGESEYNVVVPTLVDATAASGEYSAFMVRAATSSPYTFFDSGAEVGYSVDNLPPGTPAPFTAAYLASATNLHWGVSTALDFASFRLYRGTSETFVPSAGNLVTTTPDTGYVDAGAPGFYYKLSAVDVNGNESPYALVGPQQTVEAPGEVATLDFALDAMRPNPARARELVARFALPGAAAARLELIDIAGRRIVDREVSGAGRHAVALAGDRPLRAGVYLVRLSQGPRDVIRRAVVIE